MARFRLLALFAVAMGLCGLLNLQPQVPRQVPPVAARGERLLADTPERIPAPREIAAHPAGKSPTRLRHSKKINSVAMRPDGKTVATSAEGSAVVIEWDTATGCEVRRYFDIGLPALSTSILGYTPDGRRLLASSDNGRTAIFDTTTGELVARMPGGSIVISPDGKTAAGFETQTKLTPHLLPVAVWDLETGTKIGSPGPVPAAGPLYTTLCFSPDGKELATSVRDGTIYVLSVAGDKAVRQIAVTGHEGGVHTVVWPRADRLIAVWYNGFASHDPVTGKQIDRRTGTYDDWLTGVMTTPDGRVFAGIGGKRELIEIDPRNLNRLRSTALPFGRGDQPTLATSRDGNLIALVIGLTVRLLDAKTGKSLHPDLDLYPVWPVTEMRVSANGSRILTTSFFGSMRVWDAATCKPIAAMNDDGHLYDPQLTPDGRWVVGIDGAGLVGIGGGGGSYPLVVWEAETGKEVFRQPPPDEGERYQRMIGLDPEGHAWVAAGGPAREIARYEIPSGKRLRTLAAPDSLYAILSPDGKRMAVAGWSAFAVRDLDPAAEWKVIAKYPGRVGDRMCGGERPPCPELQSFTPDGRLIVSGGMATREGTSGKPIVVVNQPRFRGSVDFSPNGRRMAFASRDQDNKILGLYVCETATLAEITRADLPERTEAVAVSPDGRKLVVARNGGLLEVRGWNWDAEELPGLSQQWRGDLWGALADRDPKVALSAARRLAADPGGTVALLSNRVKPADPARVATLIAELGDDDFETREKATAGLAELGWRAESALREAHAKSPSAEVRNRARGLIQKSNPVEGRTADETRMVRAVEVLERIGSAEARELLAKWAKDYPGTILAAEATAANNRLAIRK